MDPVQERCERRLEAGDWVVATGAAAGTARGLGKLTGGEYDRIDGTLTKARVELAAGVRWIDPGQLQRIDPDDEAALAAHALELDLVPEPRAAELQAKLAMFRVDRAFVRTPGLLDAVWAALADPLGAPGLVEWFESGGAAPPRAEPFVLRLVPLPRAAPRPTTEPPHPSPSSPELQPQASFEAQLKPQPWRVESSLVRQVVYGFGAVVVVRLAADLRIERGSFSCLQEAIAERATLPQLVATLTAAELETACAVTGCREQLMDALARAGALPPPASAADAPRPKAAWVGSPITEAQAIDRILEAMNGRYVRRLLSALGIPRTKHETPRQTLRRSRPRLPALLAHMGPEQLRVACRACRVSHTAAPGAEGMRQALASLAERAPSTPSDVFARVLSSLGATSLARVVESIGEASPSGDGLPRALEAVLRLLSPHELRAACEACGLGARESEQEDELRAALRDLAGQDAIWSLPSAPTPPVSGEDPGSSSRPPSPTGACSCQRSTCPQCGWW